MLDQSAEAISRVVGPRPSINRLLVTFKDAMSCGLTRDFSSTPISASDDKLLAYLISTMGGLGREQLRVLFLDRGHHLTADEVVSTGTVTKLAFFPRPILQRALELNATALILVHNHPGGSPQPSNADVIATRQLQDAGRHLEITILDHLVIAGSRWTSMAAEGRI